MQEEPTRLTLVTRADAADDDDKKYALLTICNTGELHLHQPNNVNIPKQAHEADQDMWTVLLPSTRQTVETQGFLFPSLAHWGEARLSLLALDHPSVDKTLALQHATSLAHLFDVVSDPERSKHASASTRRKTKLLYLTCVAIALDYLDHMPDDPMGVRALARAHRAFCSRLKIDLEDMNTFSKQVMAVARSQLRSTPGIVSTASLEDATLYFAITGISCLLTLHAPERYSGAVVAVDPDVRELAVAQTYDEMSSALHVTPGVKRWDPELFAQVQFALMFGKRGIGRVLDYDAYVVDDDATCATCQEPIGHESVSSGMCHLCPRRSIVLCTSCSDGVCQFCNATCNDYEHAATHMMCSVWRMIVRLNQAGKPLS